MAASLARSSSSSSRSSAVFVMLAVCCGATESRARFAEFLRQRVSVPSSAQGSVAYWRSCGELSDPGSGKVICRVEGVEATRWHPANVSRVAIARRYRYVDAETGEELKKVGRRKARQPSSYVSVVSHTLLEDGRSVQVDAMLNDKPVAPSRATFTATETASRLDAYVAPDGERGRPAQKLVGLSARGPSSPQLSRAQRGLRCRESYTGISDLAATYSRFGECPAWLGPGKLCALDLDMRKLSVASDKLPDLDDDRLFDTLLTVPSAVSTVDTTSLVGRARAAADESSRRLAASARASARWLDASTEASLRWIHRSAATSNRWIHHSADLSGDWLADAARFSRHASAQAADAYRRLAAATADASRHLLTHRLQPAADSAADFIRRSPDIFAAKSAQAKDLASRLAAGYLPLQD